MGAGKRIHPKMDYFFGPHSRIRVRDAGIDRPF